MVVNAAAGIAGGHTTSSGYGEAIHCRICGDHEALSHGIVSVYRGDMVRPVALISICFGAVKAAVNCNGFIH